MKTAILYESWHHGNTKKLCEAIAEKSGAELFNVKAGVPELEEYDLIGIASGIAYSKFYKDITHCVRESFPQSKRVFLLYTCGKLGGDFTREMKSILNAKDCEILGTYGCRGFDTYGPLKLIGGLNKKSPTPEEVQGAVDFFNALSAE